MGLDTALFSRVSAKRYIKIVSLYSEQDMYVLYYRVYDI